MASLQLPQVPAGTNPYTVYLGLINGLLYRDPGNGFRARLLALTVMMGVCMCLATIYLTIVIVDARKNGSKNPLWLFRLAPRRGGSYIVTNAKIFTGLFTIIYGGVTMGYIWDSYKVFVLQGSQAQTAGWRSTNFIAIFMQGWLITWASLQASLLTTDHHARQILSPRVANALFVVLGLSLLTVSTVMAAINIMGGNALWHGYTVIEAGLKKFEREWVPGESELPKIVTLLPELNGLMNSAGYYQKCNIAQLSVMTSVPLIVIAVNLGSLRLAMLIKQQISFNITQCVGPLSAGTQTQMTMHTVGTGSASRNGSMSKDRSESLGGKSHLSRNDLVYLASRRGSSTAERDRLKHIQALQKAKSDLVVIALIIMAALGVIAGICLFVLYMIVAEKLLTASWAEYEIALFGTQYTYAIAMTFAFTCLIYNAWTSRSIAEVDALPLNFSTIGAMSTTGILPTASRQQARGSDSTISLDSYNPPPLPAKDFSYEWPTNSGKPFPQTRESFVEIEVTERIVERVESRPLEASGLAAQRRRPSVEFM